jgi:DNA modification methylase
MKHLNLFFGNCVPLLKRLPQEFVNLIFTDIPYGINFKSNRQGLDRKSSIKVGKDVKLENKREYFTQINNDDSLPSIEWLQESYRILKNNSAIYICVHWETFGELKSQVIECGFKPKNLIVLNKSNHGMGDLKGQFAPKHELILFATKGRHILNFPEKRMNDVWDVPVKFTGAKRLHPNEKPLSWISPAILCSSKEDEIVLDPFMGSGSTGEASLKLKRKFIGMDNDKNYVEVARERLAPYMGV